MYSPDIMLYTDGIFLSTYIHCLNDIVYCYVVCCIIALSLSHPAFKKLVYEITCKQVTYHFLLFLMCIIQQITEYMYKFNITMS